MNTNVIAGGEIFTYYQIGMGRWLSWVAHFSVILEQHIDFAPHPPYRPKVNRCDASPTTTKMMRTFQECHTAATTIAWPGNVKRMEQVVYSCKDFNSTHPPASEDVDRKRRGRSRRRSKTLFYHSSNTIDNFLLYPFTILFLVSCTRHHQHSSRYRI